MAACLIAREVLLFALFGAAWYLTPLKCYRRYFFAQMGYIWPMYWAEQHFGFASPWYTLLYSLCTLPILIAIGGICKAALFTRQYRIRPLLIATIIALGVSRAVYLGLPHGASLNDWINLTESAFELAAAILIMNLAGYVLLRGVCMLLGFLWFAQSLFGYGYMLNWQLPGWAWMNQHLPWMLLVSAALFLVWNGLPARPYSHPPRLRLVSR